MKRSRVLAIVAAFCISLSLSSCMLPEIAERFLSGAGKDAGEVSSTASVEPEPSLPESQPESSEPAASTQRVGKAGIGFVDVPADWVLFQDAAGGSDLQYSDVTGTDIITMNQFDISALSAEEQAAFTAEDAAYSVWNNIEQRDGDSVMDIQGATVTLAGYDAYQVYASYTDGVFLCSWCLMDEQGIIYYVAAEGPSDTIMDTVAMIEATYSPHG